MGKASRKKTNKVTPFLLDTANHARLALSPQDQANFPFQRQIPNKEKISYALATLLDAVVERGATEDQYMEALNFIEVAWNISVLPADQQAGKLQNMITTLAGEDEQKQRMLRGIFETLIVKKKMLFPNDQRTIMSAEVWIQADQVRVRAAVRAPLP